MSEPPDYSASPRLCPIRVCLAAFFFSCAAALAFPPAPHYTLYGIVRDQVGQTVTAEGAEVVLSIRPESWIFSEESAPVNAVHGEIHDSTYLGELAQYNFLAGGRDLKIVEMNPHLSGRENGHKFFAKVNSDDVVILQP